VRIDTLQTVEAPEGVELGLRIAGPFPRAAAVVLDLFMATGVLIAVSSLLSVLGDLGAGLAAIFAFGTIWLAGVAFEALGGATPGKRVIGLCVVRDDGTPIGWTQALLRNLLSSADFLPVGYVFGLLSCLTSPRFKRLGDRVAGTVVVHVEPKPRPVMLARAQPEHPPLALSSEEQAAIVDYAGRISTWTQARAIEIADRLRSLTGARGREGAERVLSWAHWIEGRR
jgi:uncharacterized RDD family membrane protein YckC